jgi:hypothetical protein
MDRTCTACTSDCRPDPLATRRAPAAGKRRGVKQAPAWSDQEVLQVLTAQEYITRCEQGVADFVGLEPLVEDWWEARVRHAVAKEPRRIERARARLITVGRKITRTKIEWSEGPASRQARERLIATSHTARVVPLEPGRPRRRRR